ncbi:hypothetical protein ACFQVA_01315 [Actinomadura keratinilytica]
MRVARVGEDTVSIAAVDVEGAPVLSADSLILRAPSALRAPTLHSSEQDGLLRLEWVAAPEGGAAPRAPSPSVPTGPGPARWPPSPTPPPSRPPPTWSWPRWRASRTTPPRPSTRPPRAPWH